MACACCGTERETVSLPSGDDLRVCRQCLGWLVERAGVSSTPTLPVLDMDEAVAFYERAGFDVRRYIDDTGDPGGFAFVTYDDERSGSAGHSAEHAMGGSTVGSEGPGRADSEATL
jgi:hypothetical protein